MEKAILTVAGFDPTGGAGLSSDIKVCSYYGVTNVAAVSAVVVQDPGSVKNKTDIDPLVFRHQVEVLAEYYDISLINVGIFADLHNLDFILKYFPKIKCILDPVFKSGSGEYSFISQEQVSQFKPLLKGLFLITPNVPEAMSLSGIEIKTVADMKASARVIKNDFKVENVLVKGGHLMSAGNKSVDILLDKNGFFELESKLTDFRVHGTGSFLNSALAVFIFNGESLRSAFQKAHNLLQERIKSVSSSHPVINIS